MNKKKERKISRVRRCLDNVVQITLCLRQCQHYEEYVLKYVALQQ